MPRYLFWFLIFVAVMIAVSAMAPVKTHADEPEITMEDTCFILGDMAATIMKARQSGVPMSTVMGVFAKSAQSEKLGNFTQVLIASAYEQPRWNTGENQVKAAQDFRNQVEVMCYKNRNQVK